MHTSTSPQHPPFFVGQLLRRTRWSLYLGVFSLMTLWSGCGEVTVTQVSGCEDCPERCIRSTEGSSGSCVDCIEDKHCQSNGSLTRKCLDNACVCGSNKDCPAGLVCGSPDKGKGGCVECLTNNDCGNEDFPVCSYNECVACAPKAKRVCEPEGSTACAKGEQICQNTGTWGECQGYTLCKSGEKCVNEQCVPDCPEPPPCTEVGKICSSNIDDLPGEYKECTKSAKGCFELSDIKQCGAREFCDKGSCIPFTCPKAECQLDETQCANKDEYRACIKDKNGCLKWSDKQKCKEDETCRDSLNRCSLCEPGEKEVCYGGPENTKGVGICRAGEHVCADDGTKWGDCVGVVLPVIETCNGLDDDCNGKIDDNLTPKPCANQVGQCKGTVARCGGTKGWLSCEEADYRKTFSEFEVKETLCDGIDNDCDGQVDNGLTPQKCNRNVGVCVGAVKTCDGQNGWKACTDANYKQISALYESDETLCDGKDNDCDGLVDELYPKKGTTCYAGVGSCRKSGRYVCSASQKAIECTAKAGSPTTESCNGRDDDCDGRVDDNAPCPRGTACSSGSCRTCSQPSSKCSNFDLFCTSTAPSISCKCGFTSYCYQKSSSIFCSGCCAWRRCH